VYFTATKLLREQGRGPTIIISPLLALMRNQIDTALSYGVRLETINSDRSLDENKQTAKAFVKDQHDALIISPEKLADPWLREEVLLPIAGTVGLFVIDEAHCISDWGHDFRPDYKRIKEILKHMPPNMPVLATTATANNRVRKDIESQLGKECAVLRGPLTRTSIHLKARFFPEKSQRLAWLADTIPRLEGTGIIYCATIRDANTVTDWLRCREVNVAAYYGGNLHGFDREESRARKLQLEDDLLNNRVKALVATSALGMGYDKPDLSFVIHFQCPGSAISYYQQVGRAGRGIPKAYGVLLSGNEDDKIQQYFIDTAFPREDQVAQILELLSGSEEGLTEKDLQKEINAPRGKIKAAIKFLAAESPGPIMKLSGPARYIRTATEYKLPRETIRRVSRRKRDEWYTIQKYLSHEGCLMQFLAQELDDLETGPCGNCANCSPQDQLSDEYTNETRLAADGFLRGMDISVLPKRGFGVYFPKYRFHPPLTRLQHEPGRALCYWGEAGLGETAKQGKKSRRFESVLVKNSRELIEDRWKPEPEPTWVTFVPSKTDSTLVSSFAESLAFELHLPCVDSIEILRENQPQKLMRNTHYRCRNLDGVFRVSPEAVRSGPVLLIDDAVDSGWTLAVIAALLREAGSDPVFPFAVMNTSNR
jgi:ATP-dependent DNA helicase RecQ